MIRLTFTLVFFFTLALSFAQAPIFIGEIFSPRTSEPLSRQFGEYHVFRLDPSSLNDYVKKEPGVRPFRLQLGSRFDWQVEIYANDLRGPGYVARAATENGFEELAPTEVKTFRGFRVNPSAGLVSLTLDQDYIYGYFEDGEETYFIEPLWYFIPESERDLFIVYPASKVIPVEGQTCGAIEMQEHKGDIQAPESPEAGNCYILELAIAADWSMRQKYGSNNGVINHTTGVMNNVANNYDNEFSDEISFLIVEHWISSCSTCDPWTSSTNPNTLLTSFRNWGPTGFSAVHDLGQLWTNRNLDGNVIGIAYLGAVCTSNRYHVLQDFSTNANLLRVLTAHEIGHNFNATHDPSGSNTIMAPSVNSSNSWSSQSISQINAFILLVDPPGGCLSICPPPLPPTPAFTANITTLCPGSFVTFFDESTNGPASWSWSMPGATPSSSTQKSPTVIYNNPGVYNVTLTVTNVNGSNSLTKNAYINVTTSGGTDFFFYEGFENGVGSWTIQNPDNGITWTNVDVSGTREGGKAMRVDNINYNSTGQRDGLISPTFSLFGRTNVTLEIDYAYARYNATRRDSLIVYISTNNGASYTRIFAATENGNGNFATSPDQTTAFNPQSQSQWCFGPGGPNCLSLNLSAYAGQPNCKIKIENWTGRGNRMYVDNVRILSNCEVFTPPASNFIGIPTSGCAPLQVNFQDLTTNSPFTWSWAFPGAIPTSSTLQNPVVLYTMPGVYTVSLTTTNPAGANTLTKPNYITVQTTPVAQYNYTVNGTTVTFNNVSSPNATTFHWDFGDGTSSTQQNPPPHVYPGAGAYVAILTASNACGSSIFPQTIIIQTPPTAAFTASPTTGCGPLSVQYTDQSTGNPTSRSWSFPGGTPATSTQQTPVVVYNAPGTYNATLIATNAQGSDTLTKTNYITVLPETTAGFSFTSDGDTVFFTNLSANANAYLWDFGDGNTSADSDPIHVYAVSGVYDVSLTAYGDCDTLTATQTVETTQVPIAGFSANQTEGCTVFSVQFTDQSAHFPTSWSWTFEGGSPASSSEQNPVVEYLTPGVFGVTLTVSNSAGSDSISIEDYISVAEGATAGFTFSVNGTQVAFTNTSANADSYLWEFGDGATSGQTNPSHDYGTDGVYTVILIAFNDCGPDTASTVVTIVTPPTAGFSADLEEGCAPLTVQFSDESSPNATSWSWTFEGGAPASSNEQNPVVEYLVPGIYGVTLTVGNAAGDDTFSVSQFIAVFGDPTADFTYTVNNGSSVTFTNASSGANAYLWDFGDGETSLETDPVHIYPGDGVYTAMLIASNDCGSDTLELVIEIVTPPSAGFSSSESTGCAPFTVEFNDESSPNATSWSWTFEGGVPASSNEQNPVVEYLTPGVYGVTLTVSNAAGDDTFSMEDYIIISGVPTAGFNSLVNGATVSFNNNSGGATEYEWHFGDGATSVQPNPEHTYATDGVYNVMLIALNACGSDTAFAEVVIVLPPTAGFSASQTQGCAPLEVQFSDQSSDNATAWAWIFEGGTPASSNQQNPLVQYLAPGVYGVTLTVSNAAGDDTETLEDYIVVAGGPAAGFTQSVSGFDASFTNTSQNANSYAWNFGDGNTSADSDPSHTYAEDGTYTVTLIATNACGSDTITSQLVVITPPFAGFSANNTSGCAPLTVQFQDLSSANATEWFWEFEGGIPSTSTSQNPTVQYLTPGVYSVSLTVSNAAGSDGATFTDYITVNPGPGASFTLNLDGNTVELLNTSQNGTSYVWNFGDGFGSTMAQPGQHTYAEDGVYTIELTAMNACGTSTTTQMVAIATAGPLALFTVNAASGCAPLEVTFNNLSSENSDSFEWSFPGGTPSTSTDFEPVVTYMTAGMYEITLTAFNANGSDAYQLTTFIDVAPAPVADFDFSIINGATATFQNVSSGANAYSWNFGDGNTSGEENPVHVYVQTGMFTVTLTAMGPCGMAQYTQEVAINEAIPSAAFTAEPATGCAPLEVQLKDVSTGNPTQWNWSFPGGTPSSSNEPNPVVTYSSAGLYSVTLQVSNAAGSDVLMQTQLVQVADIPAAGFSFEILVGNQVVFTNTTSNGTSFSWEFGDDKTSTQASPVHTYEQPGNYLVTLTAGNECGNSSITREIIISSAFDRSFLDKLLVYPNPNDGHFTVWIVASRASGETAQLRLINALGQELMRQEAGLIQGELKFIVEQRGLAAGLYWLEIQIGTQKTGTKLVIE